MDIETILIFGISSSVKYKSEPVPAPKEIDISTVRYAAG